MVPKRENQSMKLVDNQPMSNLISNGSLSVENQSHGSGSNQLGRGSAGEGGDSSNDGKVRNDLQSFGGLQGNSSVSSSIGTPKYGSANVLSLFSKGYSKEGQVSQFKTTSKMSRQRLKKDKQYSLLLPQNEVENNCQDVHFEDLSPKYDNND